MNTPEAAFEMDMLTFTQLRDFIYDKSGIYLRENRKYILEKRLGHRLKELELDSLRIITKN